MLFNLSTTTMIESFKFWFLGSIVIKWRQIIVGLRIYNIFLQVFEMIVYFFACAHRGSSSISYYYDHYFSLCCLYISHSSCTKDEQFHDYPNGIHPILCYSKKAMKKKCFVVLCEMEGVAMAHVAWPKLTIALCLSWTLKTITLLYDTWQELELKARQYESLLKLINN